VLWSISTTGMRTKAMPGPAVAAFVFVTGAFAGALLLAPLLEPLPASIPSARALPALGWTLLAGGVWWALSMTGLMWSTVRLDPARVGVLLMPEVLVGAVSAALIAGEHLVPIEIFGGGLVLCASLLEVWPMQGRRGRRAPP
jgi:drug/metabolite transporter (DMT)-like permease